MRISEAPKRILDDGLKDVIVKILYAPEYSKSALEQRIENGLNSNGYKTVRYSINKGNGFSPNQKKQFIAVNDFKIVVEEEYILFNIVNNYPGWEKYSNFIKTVLGYMPQTVYKGVSVNYISTFDNLKIFDYLDNNMNLQALNRMAGSELKYHFAREYRQDIPAFIDVILLNNKLIPQLQESPMSCINIKVQMPATELWNQEAMLESLTFIHRTEWEVFIETFMKDFFDRRGAVYDE